MMEGGGRKKRTGSSVAPWWSLVFGGYRFIIIALILQVCLSIDCIIIDII